MPCGHLVYSSSSDRSRAPGTWVLILNIHVVRTAVAPPWATEWTRDEVHRLLGLVEQLVPCCSRMKLARRTVLATAVSACSI